MLLTIFLHCFCFKAIHGSVIEIGLNNYEGCSGADPGCPKGGGARRQNLAPPTFYILMARAHAHHMNRTEHEHLSFYEFTRFSTNIFALAEINDADGAT